MPYDLMKLVEQPQTSLKERASLIFKRPPLVSRPENTLLDQFRATPWQSKKQELLSRS